MGSDARILRLPEVLDRIGISASQVYRLEKKGAFPKRLHLAERTAGFVESEVDEWIAQRMAMREVSTSDAMREDANSKEGEGRR